MTNQRFPPEYRLRRKADFDRVYGRRVYAADAVLVANGCENELPHCRLGLSVSRKVGGAVTRNRWKRLMREAFRRLRAELPAGIDLVLRPRRGAEPDFHAISESLPRLAQRIEKQLQRKRA